MTDIYKGLDRNTDPVGHEPMGHEPHVHQDFHPPILHANIRSQIFPHNCASHHDHRCALGSECRPLWIRPLQTVRLQLDQSIDGSCGRQVLSYILTGALNICMDVMILSLPIPMVWKLQTTRANKVALTGIFGLGFLYVCQSPCHCHVLH